MTVKTASRQQGPARARKASSPAGKAAEKTILKEIDAALARLDTGIARERAAMDALLERLNARAA